MSTRTKIRQFSLCATTAVATLLSCASAIAATLPDNRAWEMVSPLEKNGGETRPLSFPNGGVIQAAADGNGITYVSGTAFGEAKGAPAQSQYLARRTPTEWANENITSPTRPLEYGLVGDGGPYRAFSSDLSSGLQLYGLLPAPAGYPAEDTNLYLRDNSTGVWQPLITSPPRGHEEKISQAEEILSFEGASPDLAHIVFSSSLALTPGATPSHQRFNPTQNLYEWSAGKLAAVNVLPGVTNGETANGEAFYAVLGGGEYGDRTVSTDGSRVFWSSIRGAFPSLFVRENASQPQSPLDEKGNCTVSADACTVELDAPQEGASGGAGAGIFMAASADGSRAFFLDKEKLTPQATAGGFELRRDLYEFNTDTGHLTDLTVDHNETDERGASVRGVVGASADGTYVYFVADGVLAGENAEGKLPITERNNLYLSHNGNLTFIATLGEGKVEEEADKVDWESAAYYRTARVTPDGKDVVFDSTEALTGSDNMPVQESDCGFTEGSSTTGGSTFRPEPCKGVYRYDAETAKLTCVSCNPTSAPPTGGSKIPPGTAIANLQAIYFSRVISENGNRVFFDSSNALSPQDTNGHQDVYEWELLGEGSCTSASVGFSVASGGCVSLLSGGTGGKDSEFVDASADGSNVFFVTGQQLVSQDTDELADIYDARENGGLPAPPSPPVCSGTGCQGVPPAPPIFATPSSVTFSGEGNFAAPGTAKKRAVTSKVLTRVRKLAKALKACRTKRGKQRTICEREAERRYAAARHDGGAVRK
jgi:hypothetical protein